jgi:hypothetical protein
MEKKKGGFKVTQIPTYRIVKKSILKHKFEEFEDESFYYKYIIEKAHIEGEDITWRRIESLATESAAREYIAYLTKSDPVVIETFYK